MCYCCAVAKKIVLLAVQTPSLPCVLLADSTLASQRCGVVPGTPPRPVPLLLGQPKSVVARDMGEDVTAGGFSL